MTVLYPNTRQKQWMDCRDIYEHLVKLGDPVNVRRDVRHYMYFPTPESRKDFQTRLKKILKGFLAVYENYDPDNENPYVLIISRKDKVEFLWIWGVISEVADLVQDVGGVYDGWETEMIQPKPKIKRKR